MISFMKKIIKLSKSDSSQKPNKTVRHPGQQQWSPSICGNSYSVLQCCFNSTTGVFSNHVWGVHLDFSKVITGNSCVKWTGTYDKRLKIISLQFSGVSRLKLHVFMLQTFPGVQLNPSSRSERNTVPGSGRPHTLGDQLLLTRFFAVKALWESGN